MTNANCLEGMRCPECGATEPFRIEIKPITLTFFDSGQGCDEGFDTQWDDESYCKCVSCDCEGVVKDFKGTNLPAKEIFQAYAPNGKQIIGTLERLLAIAGIQYFEGSKADEMVYTGSTEIYWESQTTCTRNFYPSLTDDPIAYSPVFVDEDGDEWLEHKLTFRPE